MQCPLCRDEVLEPHIRNGVEVDRCPRCRGIWLDRGEIDKLVAGSPAEAGRGHRGVSERQGDDRRKARHDDDRVRRKKKRKKGFADRLADVLEELID